MKENNNNIEKHILKSMQILISEISEISKKISDSHQNNQPKTKDVWLTTAQVCKMIDVSGRTIQKYRDDGIIPFSFVLGKILYKESDIQNLLEKHYQKALKD